MAIETSYAITAKIEESGVLARYGRTITSALTWTEYTTLRILVPNNAVDLAINMGGCAAANLLFINTDAQVSIKLSGGSESLVVNSFAALSCDATSLSISNASGAAATVDILILD